MQGLHDCELLQHGVQEVRVDMQVVHTDGDSGTPRSNSGLGKDPESQARPIPASILRQAGVPAREHVYYTFDPLSMSYLSS